MKRRYTAFVMTGILLLNSLSSVWAEQISEAVPDDVTQSGVEEIYVSDDLAGDDGAIVPEQDIAFSDPVDGYDEVSDDFFEEEADETLIDELLLSEEAFDGNAYEEDLLLAEDLAAGESDLIEENVEFQEAASGRFYFTDSFEPVPAGDAADAWAGQGSKRRLLKSASPAGSSVGGYYGSQLSGREIDVYQQLLEGNWVFDSEKKQYKIPYTLNEPCEFTTTDFSKYKEEPAYQEAISSLQLDIYSAFDAFMYDYPEDTFWIYGHGMSWGVGGYQMDGIYYLELKDIYITAPVRWGGAKEQLDTLRSYTNASVSEIMGYEGYDSMTQGEKLKAVHDYICGLVNYGNAGTVIQEQHTPYGAYTEDHLVVCEGYSKLFKILVDKLGIANCILVSGTAVNPEGDGEGHMWNLVQIDGSWYFLDATWDDQTWGTFYDYFLAGSGSVGFQQSMTVGGEHSRADHLSKEGRAFTIPDAASEMFHQAKENILEQATCQHEGSAEYSCGLHPLLSDRKSDKSPYTDILPRTDHTWIIEEAVPATCTTTGLTEGKKCSICGEVASVQTVTPATGHTETIIPGVAATCTATGLTKGKMCSVCEEILTVQTVIPAKGHTEEIIPAVAATCTKTGLTEGKKCSVCGETLTAQNVIPAKGHTEEIIPGVAATCTATGLTEGKKCSVCGEILVEQEEIENIPHTPVIIPAVEPTCIETGLTEGKKCSVCGEILIEQEEVEKVPHTPVIIPAVEATCTEAGLTEGKKCSICGEILTVQTVIPAKGHTEEIIPAVAATCTEPGLTEGKKCSVCGKILVEQ